MSIRYDVWFIGYALLCLLAAEAFGHQMAQSGDHSLFPAHAHLALLGWTTPAIFGVLHHLYPALGKSRLAPIQFGLWLITVPIFTFGIVHVLITKEQDATWAIVGEVLTISATLLFTVMFVGKALLAKPA